MDIPIFNSIDESTDSLGSESPNTMLRQASAESSRSQLRMAESTNTVVSPPLSEQPKFRYNDGEFDTHPSIEDDFIHARREIIKRTSYLSDVALQNYYVNPYAPITRLPTEILLLVFQYVGKAKSDWIRILPVCRYWSTLLLELIWFRPIVQGENAYRGIKHVMTNLKQNPQQRTTNDYRQWIKRLNLSFIIQYAKDDFLDLFEGCSNLERLTLVNCSKLTSPSIIRTLGGCTRLQSIDMTGINPDHINDALFTTLAENCPRLQGLYAPGCVSVSEKAIIKLIDSCPLLKRIKLSENKNITDVAVKRLTANCKYLVEIDLLGCQNVTDEGLAEVFSSLDQLREFRISHNENISYACIEQLDMTPSLDRLRILDFTGCTQLTDKVVEKFVVCAPRLRNVVLSKCHRITDASLRALSTLGKSLHYIHLGHCGLITDWGVKDLVKLCHRIQYIDLACCGQLTNESLISLADLPKLRRIGLVKCANITDRGLTELCTRRGPNDTLERVHLSYCTNLTLFPIMLLLRNCPRLTHLSLTGIQEFLRSDFTVFCRPPPPEFTPHQQQLFCVFSGTGVKQLRTHLTQLLTNPMGLQLGPQEMREAIPNGFGVRLNHPFPNGAAPAGVGASLLAPGNVMTQGETLPLTDLGVEEAGENFRMLQLQRYQIARAQQQERMEQQYLQAIQDHQVAQRQQGAVLDTPPPPPPPPPPQAPMQHRQTPLLQFLQPQDILGGLLAESVTNGVNINADLAIGGLTVNLRGDPQPHLQLLAAGDGGDEQLSTANIQAFIAQLREPPLPPNVIALMFERTHSERPQNLAQMYLRHQEYHLVREREAKRQQMQRFFALRGISFEHITRDLLLELFHHPFVVAAANQMRLEDDDVDLEGDVLM
ncbi:hypothetical protein BABINDRAFT_160881 [Babjeviella inositovora NRRL Y-12698]|uniref:Uncharacterized protein n=1 Tax=Babjeviella inositovora NRRL Y-12698 TaxID=984486 RepID=A0A1E3QSK7_9ASCO|nr:uncharacterized protein BABINDRAFT_160881 [Babjeviella inositovora NRRL Y-12698]ODQ80628.1 hypothetical protein BABINDRAFT_160881 [Babjeviella inositovora NRRL Y-12698]